MENDVENYGINNENNENKGDVSSEPSISKSDDWKWKSFISENILKVLQLLLNDLFFHYDIHMYYKCIKKTKIITERDYN